MATSSSTTAVGASSSDFVSWKDIGALHNVMRTRAKTKEYNDRMQTVPRETLEEIAVELIDIVSSSNTVKMQPTTSTEVFALEETAYQASLIPTLQYKSKIKLHGSNGGVIITPDGRVQAQSRNQVMTDPNQGFVKLVHHIDLQEYWPLLATPSGKIVVFGEHCGPKINCGPKHQPIATALNLLPHDIFAVFAIDLGDDRLLVEPDQILDFLTCGGQIQLPPYIRVIPWFATYQFDFADRQALKLVLETIDEQVNSIDREDSWMKDTFGLVGPGEGLVFYPMCQTEMSIDNISRPVLSRTAFGDLAFKAKGVHHRVVTTTTSASLTASNAKTPEAFAQMVCPEPRLLQGVTATGGLDVNSKSDPFVKWVLDDVYKECQEELKASKLQWKHVKEHVRTLAYEWFVRQLALSFVPEKPNDLLPKWQQQAHDDLIWLISHGTQPKMEEMLEDD